MYPNGDNSMTDGQYFTGGTCPDCNTSLPPLIDDGGWGLATCPGCNKKFTTDGYRNAGGEFHTGTGCKCDRCRSMEG